MAKNQMVEKPISALDQLRQKQPDFADMEWEELLTTLSADDGLIEAREEFELLNRGDKEKLIGVPLIILDYKKNKGDFGDYFTIWCRTPHGSVILNDGSTGMARQIQVLENSNEHRPILCKKGLRSSDYTVELPNGRTLEGTTFYFTPDFTQGMYRDIQVSDDPLLTNSHLSRVSS